MPSQHPPITMDPSRQPSLRMYEAPPWEQRQMTKVPFVSATAVEPRRHNARQDSAGSIPLQRLETSFDDDRDYAATTRGDYDFRQRSATPTMAGRRPYDTVIVPAGPKTAPELPAFVTMPPSPPDSRLGLDDSGKVKAWAPRNVVALPGTMSARGREERESSRRRERSHSRAKHVQAVDTPVASTSFGKKLRAAMKDLFRRAPVDESSFEKIQDRHWAE